MNTFFLIIKKHFNITDYPFQNLDSLQKIIFFMLINKKDYSLKNKFKYINEQINNIFFTEEQKEDFINIFCKIQKTYFAFARFAYIYKYKKAKIVVDFDLCLNPIDINNKNSICLLQEKYKYCFRINDLINIIDTALSNSPNFFSDPLISKNPYNNVPFNKSTLYNIYFKILKGSQKENYKGLPGYGDKKVYNLLKDLRTEEEMQELCIEHFKLIFGKEYKKKLREGFRICWILEENDNLETPTINDYNCIKSNFK